jgi:tagatose kinase
MSEVWTMGELLAEVMRPRAGMSLAETGEFLGPFPSGAPGIFIDTVARLGHSAAIASAVGDDDFGACILERLKKDGVAVQSVDVVPGKSTGVAFVTYSKDGSRRFLFHWDGTPAVMGRVPAPVRVEGTKYLHIMGCSLMANEAFRARVFDAVELFAKAGARISFDPNIRFELLQGRAADEIVGPVLRRASLLFPGEKELCLLGGREEPVEAATALFAQHPGLQLIVLKRGSRGASVLTRSGRQDVPAYRVKEKDPTGAGDCFDAGVLCGLLEGKSPADAARLGAAVGALNAQAFGPMEGRISAAAAQAVIRKGR